MKSRAAVVLLILTVLLSSCDDFLDIKPVGRVIPETQEQYRALITNAYSKFPADRGLATFRSDEVDLTGANSMDVSNYLDIYSWNDIGKNDFSDDFKWKDYYYVIYNANYIIENVSALDGQQNEGFRQLVGEAYLLRAYSHFTLANLFAPHYNAATAAATPAIPLSLDTNTDVVLKKSTLSEVYNSILSDIANANTLLNITMWPVGEHYRFSKAASAAFEARVHLYMESWDLAEAAALTALVYNNQLVDLNASTKVVPSQFDSPESIMALDYVMRDAYVAALKPSASLVAMYPSSDIRKRTTFKEVALGVFSIKKGGSIDFRVSFRTAELYLNLAEVYARTGNLNESRTYLFALMQTRLTASYFAQEKTRLEAIADKDVLLTEVLAERYRELALEGHRWFDLRRTTQPRLVKTFNGETFTLNQGDARYTIPFPKEAKENNSNL
ncbi:MAG: RagB/SusD family nutrient uptake outer membrane protein [Bacteroidales bacterium]|nr:RagB/SusD family nutrient uptake outer membrane protein [Bacteroidales bacterium]MBN2749842.1 RagB/SusD family nutrient uptake outer membrane protein [Bacteroidales bacterium]